MRNIISKLNSSKIALISGFVLLLLLTSYITACTCEFGTSFSERPFQIILYDCSPSIIEINERVKIDIYVSAWDDDYEHELVVYGIDATNSAEINDISSRIRDHDWEPITKADIPIKCNDLDTFLEEWDQGHLYQYSTEVTMTMSGNWRVKFVHNSDRPVIFNVPCLAGEPCTIEVRPVEGEPPEPPEPPQPPSKITINFDELTSIPEGSSARIPSHQYESQGVIISRIDPETETPEPSFVVVEHLVSGNGAHSLPYSVAFGFRGAKVQIRFVDPDTGTNAVTDFVSAWVGDKSRETDTITMTAYDLEGNEIESASYTAQPSAQLDDATDFGLVEIHAEGIHRVVFTDDSPSGGDFDDLTFSPPVLP